MKIPYITRFNVLLDPVAGISAPSVSPADMTKLEKHFMSHRYIHLKVPFCSCLNGVCFQDSCSGFSLEALNGFMFGVDATKSLILTLACIERVITVEEAVRKQN